MNFSEACKVLGLSDNPTKEEAKKSFKKLAQKYHPDVNKSPDAEDNFKKINEAYQIVEAGKPEFSNHFGNIPNNFSGVNFNIEDLFGFSQNKRVILKDIELRTTISFKESILGCKKTINYNRNVKCHDCNGNGKKLINNGCASCNGLGFTTSRNGVVVVRITCKSCGGRQNFQNCSSCNLSGFVSSETFIEVNIPPKIINNSALRLVGIGNFGGSIMGGDSYSNVILYIDVESDPNLTFDGDCVIYNMNISLLEALQGKTVKIPTINGESEISIPQLSKNKDFLYLKDLNQKVFINVNYGDNTQDLIEFLKKGEQNAC